MKQACLILHLHQPAILNRYHFFDIGNHQEYFDVHTMKTRIQKMAGQCYLPLNEMLLKLITETEGRFKMSVYISGVTIDQFAEYAPEVLDSFQKLSATGCMEFLCGTWSHSPACLVHQDAFEQQVRFHQQTIFNHFRQTSGVFLNPGLIYSDDIGARVANMGFKGIMAEGTSILTGRRSPGFIYSNAINRRMFVILRNPGISDHFANGILNPAANPVNSLVNADVTGFLTSRTETLLSVVLDYGIFENAFRSKNRIPGIYKQWLSMANLPGEFSFNSPGEIVSLQKPVAPLNVPHPLSGMGASKDLSVWNGNDIQQDALRKLYDLWPLIKDCNDRGIIKIWNFLQSHDHFLSMSDSDMSRRFRKPDETFDSPWETYICYMNILNDFRLLIS